MLKAFIPLHLAKIPVLWAASQLHLAMAMFRRILKKEQERIISKQIHILKILMLILQNTKALQAAQTLLPVWVDQLILVPSIHSHMVMVQKQRALVQ